MTYARVITTLFGCLISFPAWSDSDSTFILPSGVEVAIVEAVFHENKFDIDGCSRESNICRIDGKVPYGSSFGLPKTYVKTIEVTFHGASYFLDSSNMYNAWGARPLVSGPVRYFGGKCSDDRNCDFRGVFSDAAGTFVAEWRIDDGYQTRTVLTSSGDIVDLFMRNIDPPSFD